MESVTDFSGGHTPWFTEAVFLQFHFHEGNLLADLEAPFNPLNNAFRFSCAPPILPSVMAGIRCSVVLLLRNCLTQSTKKTWNVYNNTCCQTRGSRLIERMLFL
jgi:hypothetical protein